MEKSAIKKGFAELKPGEAYDALYASALCRAKADWIIGINATRLFSVLHGKTLNVGRVQTPTLKTLADRDAAITSFKKETYHIVRLDVGGAEAASARISDAADAEVLKTACDCLLYTSYYDAAAIAEPIAPTTAARYRGGRSAGHKYDGEVPGQGKVQGINRARTGGYYDEALMPTTRNKRDVWHINTVPYKGGRCV